MKDVREELEDKIENIPQKNRRKKIMGMGEGQGHKIRG